MGYGVRLIKVVVLIAFYKFELTYSNSNNTTYTIDSHKHNTILTPDNNNNSAITIADDSFIFNKGAGGTSPIIYRYSAITDLTRLVSNQEKSDSFISYIESQNKVRLYTINTDFDTDKDLTKTLILSKKPSVISNFESDTLSMGTYLSQPQVNYRLLLYIAIGIGALVLVGIALAMIFGSSSKGKNHSSYIKSYEKKYITGRQHNHLDSSTGYVHHQLVKTPCRK